MKKLLLSAMFLLATQTLFAQVITARMITDWERAKAYTKEYLDAMPGENYGFKPTPEIRSFAQQMGHLADANFAFAAAASGKPSPFQGSVEKMADQSKTTVSKETLESYDFVISALKSLKDTDLPKDMKVFGKETKTGMAFEKAFEHQTHHRGQTTVYMRLKGIQPPQEKLF